jgi:aryl-alcohol dehydrogenase-like predicted oxidoreductase
MGIDWASLSRIALRFSLSHPATSVVLAGARTVAELESAVNAAEEGPLPDTLLSVARRVAVDDDELVNPARWPIP